MRVYIFIVLFSLGCFRSLLLADTEVTPNADLAYASTSSPPVILDDTVIMKVDGVVADVDWIKRTRETNPSPVRPVAKHSFRSIFALLVVLGGLFLVNGFIRRSGRLGARIHSGALVRLVSRTRIGARQELVVVHFHGKHLLLGVTPENIQVLMQSDAPHEGNACEAVQPGAAKEGQA
jgi:flagellar biogenesis protein FliO